MWTELCQVSISGQRTCVFGCLWRFLMMSLAEVCLLFSIILVSFSEPGIKQSQMLVCSPSSLKWLHCFKGGCGGGFWSWSRLSSFAMTQICWSMLNARQVLKYWAFMTVQHRSRAQVSSCVQECHFVSLLNISSVTHMQHQNKSSATLCFSMHGVGRWALVSRFLDRFRTFF